MYIYIHIHQYIILNVVFATPSQLIKTTTRHRLCSAGIDFGVVVVVVGRASLLCASVRSQTLCKTVRIGSTEAPESDRSIWTGTVSSQFWGNSKGRLSQRDSSSHRTQHRECLEVGRGNVTLSCSYRSLCCNWLSQGSRLSVPNFGPSQIWDCATSPKLLEPFGKYDACCWRYLHRELNCFELVKSVCPSEGSANW